MKDSIDLTPFKHQVPLSIRFMDLDMMNHVNNARYLNYLEEARIDYSQKIMGLFSNIEELSVVVARIEIDYISPLFFGEELVVYNRIFKIGEKSLQFESLIKVIGNKERIAARAIQVLVSINPKTGKSTAIPTNIQEKIQDFENM